MLVSVAVVDLSEGNALGSDEVESNVGVNWPVPTANATSVELTITGSVFHSICCIVSSCCSMREDSFGTLPLPVLVLLTEDVLFVRFRNRVPRILEDEALLLLLLLLLFIVVDVLPVLPVLWCSVSTNGTYVYDGKLSSWYNITKQSPQLTLMYRASLLHCNDVIRPELRTSGGVVQIPV